MRVNEAPVASSAVPPEIDRAARVGTVTVTVVLTLPQVIVAVPAVVPAMTEVPFKTAILGLLLEQVPSSAELGTGVNVAVAPLASVEGVTIIPVSAAGVTVSVADTLPQVIVAVPPVVPAMTVVPLTVATAILLLEQVPSEAPKGTGTIVEVPPAETDEGDTLMLVRLTTGTTGVTLLDAAEAALVPALLVAVTVKV